MARISLSSFEKDIPFMGKAQEFNVQHTRIDHLYRMYMMGNPNFSPLWRPYRFHKPYPNCSGGKTG